MSLTGKGMTIWKVPACDGGNIQSIARKAQGAGLTHVLVKVADGPRPYNEGQAAGLVGALRSAGIAAWGWQYVYGDSPLDEADAALAAIKQLGLGGFVVNAEREYEGKFGPAAAYMERIAKASPGTPLVLTSFRSPEYHAAFPWTEFLSGCVYNMPQVFWVKSHNPAGQLADTIAQFKQVYPIVPIIPTGPAYAEADWRPSASEIREFMAAARQNGLDGVNFWNWDYAGSPQGADLWQAISGFVWSEQGASRVDPVQALFDALNRSDVEAILKLYEPEGILVTSTATLRGPHELRVYYTNLLGDVLPRGHFTVDSRASEDNVEHVTWSGSAASPAYSIRSAEDTIGIRQGFIQFHTSLYRVG